MFFERDEIKKLLGVLILCFPGYEQKLRDYVPDATNNYLKKLYDYYKSCTQTARTVIQSHVDLKNWMDNIRTNHGSMAENTDYAFSGLLYQILEFEPFKTYISTDVGVGVKDERTVRNVSIFTEVLGKFEYYANISVFSKKNIALNQLKDMNILDTSIVIPQRYDIEYENRPNSRDFLNKDIISNPDRRYDYLDFLHMFNVYDSVKAWLSDFISHNKEISLFIKCLFEHVVFIWHEIDGEVRIGI